MAQTPEGLQPNNNNNNEINSQPSQQVNPVNRDKMEIDDEMEDIDIEMDGPNQTIVDPVPIILDSDVTSNEAGPTIQRDVINENGNDSMVEDDEKHEIIDKSITAQIARIKKNYPCFKINRLFEKFIFHEYARNDIISFRAKTNIKLKWDMDDYEQYVARREIQNSILNDGKKKYLQTFKAQTLMVRYAEKQATLAAAEADIQDLAKQVSPDSNVRLQKVQCYDQLREAFLRLSEVKPYPKGHTLAYLMENKEPNQLRKEIKPGNIIWMDLLHVKKGRKRRRSPRRNNNNNNNNDDDNSYRFPSERLNKRKNQQQQKKKSSNEALAEIKKKLLNEKGLNPTQKQELLSLLEDIDTGAEKVTSQRGYDRAEAVKEELEESGEDDLSPPPNKRRKLRFNQAEERAKEEVKIYSIHTFSLHT